MQKMIGEFWEKNWLSGVEVENVQVLKARFERKIYFRGDGGGIFGICGTFSVQNYTFLSKFVAPFGNKPHMIIDQKKSKKKA